MGRLRDAAGLISRRSRYDGLMQERPKKRVPPARFRTGGTRACSDAFQRRAAVYEPSGSQGAGSSLAAHSSAGTSIWLKT